jgi:chemotaxis protein MotB
MSRPERHKKPFSSQIWLVSFTDLMCLLLVFFVLLFSMSEPAPPRWKALVSGFATLGGAGAGGGDLFTVDQVPRKGGLPLGYLGPLLIGHFAGDPDLVTILPEREEDRLIIGIPDHLLFDPGATAFSRRGERIIFLLSGVLSRLDNRIEVIGQAGRETGEGPGGHLEWEVSLMRAVAVAGALREAGYRRPLAARARGGIESAADPAPHSALITIDIRDREGP